MRRTGVTAILAVILAVVVLGGLVVWWSPSPGSAVFSGEPAPSAARPAASAPAARGAAATVPLSETPVVRIAVAGDTGTGTAEQDSVAARIEQRSQADPYDALLLLGDMIYENGDVSMLQSRVTAPYQPLLDDGARLIPVLGNHDYASDEEQQIMTELGQPSLWYVEQIGPVRLVVLDSNRVDDAEQTSWLERTLSEPVAPGTWTIAAMHHPAYSSGVHGSTPEVQRSWVPLFTKYRVPLVLAGHDHDYERTTPQDGVTYVVSGAGSRLRPVGHRDFTATSISTLHYLDLAVSADHLTGTAIDPAGTVIDTFTLSR